MSQLYYQEGYSNGHWNNHQKYSDEVPGLEWSQDQPWCETCVTWVFQTAGAPSGSYVVSASVAEARDFWKNKGRFSEYPAIGAQVIFGVNGDVHTGIVISYTADRISVISGNTNNDGSPEGNQILIKDYDRRSNYVYGYGYPEYPEGIVSADPNWGGNNSAGSTPVAIPDFPGRSYFVVGARNNYVTEVDNCLIRKGYTRYSANGTGNYSAGPVYTTYTKRNVQAFQIDQGWGGQDADGLVGPETWKRLHQ
jgi:hypothetical protein